MTSEHNKYFKPPTRVAVFAHLVGAPDPAHNGFVPAGLLENMGENLSPTFTYGTKYVGRPNAIEVDPRALPLAGELGGTTRFVLHGLTEFGGIRDSAPDAWGRRVIENMLGVRTGTLPEVAYLLEAGSDRVGALDVRADINAEGTPHGHGVIELGRLLDLANRIENQETVPQHLLPYFNGLSSAGGARPKATVRDDAGVLYLAKFPSKDDKACNAVLEAGALDLARQAGLRVPPVHVKTIGDQKVLFIRRFDRFWAEPGERLAAGQESWLTDPGITHNGIKRTEGRLAVCSAMTLIGVDEYDAQRSSYEDIAKAIRQYGAPGFIKSDVQEMFARMVFNIIVNNNDDHLRNHAFVYDVAAKGWRLSPLYDVLPMNTAAFTRHLHLEVGERGREASLDNALSRWSAFHSSRTDAVQAIHQVWTASRAYLEKFEKYGATALETEYVQGALRRLEDLASPALSKELRELKVPRSAQAS